MSMDPLIVDVIIPYFQRRSGILRAALASVAGQQVPARLRVWIVDDGSPVPATLEVADLVLPERMTLNVLTQDNAGPGAARNRALDALPADARLVAFLDSDDAWDADHLATALAGLDTTEAYFGNHYQLHQELAAFERGGKLQLAAHEALGPGLYRYRGDMIGQILSGNLIGTSTVVYRYDRHPRLRFDTQMRNAGEDYLFWLDLAAAGASFAFSTRALVRYGEGVNIYAASGWGTEGFTLRTHNEIRYRRLALARYPVDAATRAYVQGRIGELRASFLLDLLHRLRHGLALPWGLLGRHLLGDPATLGALGTVIKNLRRRAPA